MNRFCDQCGNTYQYKLPASKVCLNCGDTRELNEGEIIETSDIAGKALDYPIFINTKYDYTLPRIKINCVNSDCETNADDYTGSVPEIIVYQRNPKEYNIGYLCTHCNIKWFSKAPE